jgi:hypothetical protein
MEQSFNSTAGPPGIYFFAVPEWQVAGLQAPSVPDFVQLSLHSGLHLPSLCIAGSHFPAAHFAGSQFAPECFTWDPGTGASPAAFSQVAAEGHFEQSFTASVFAFFSFFSSPCALTVVITTNASMTRVEIPKMTFFMTD